MYRNKFRMLVASAAAVSVLFTAGCGVEKSSKDASGLSNAGVDTKLGGDGPIVKPENFEGTGGVVYLQKAAEATTAVETQHMSLEMTSEGLPMGLNLNMSVEGQMDIEANRAEMVMTMGDMGLGSGESFDMTMIIDGDTAYVKSPMLSEQAGITKPWMSFDAAALGDGGQVSQSANPEAFLEFLKNSGSDVSEVGEEEIRGVKTTHLSTNLDVEAIMDEADPEKKAEMEKSLEGMSGNGFSEIPIDVWVDGDGMVRKMVMTFDFSKMEDTSASGIEMTGNMTMTMELFDFGKPVDITIPSDDEVAPGDPSIFED